ncbi:uncharacterized protein M6B38_293690 [Iris pallida]|uniref:Stress up-regulated Nod 19 n=1 Tax=Iris pallida TaxID=29817 RepID=A0AAX6HVF4_IRIPA|nr:uncharacterized protein M6B38_293690 [Iris pallida]
MTQGMQSSNATWKKPSRRRMRHSQLWIVLLVVLLLTNISVHALRDSERVGRSIKSSVFLSPAFFLREGSVDNKFYYDIPFPRGHIAIRSFHAEVVDEKGAPVPLHETYLHHWVVSPYYGPKGTQVDFRSPEYISVRNEGICKYTLGQYFGLGSETRRTSTWVPEPYGMEVGDPTKIPSGYEERWFLNIHAIDTRGVEDRLGCTECKCSLYNVTKDGHGRTLRNDYIGGLLCCYDQTQCQLREGFKGGKARKLYLRYTVKWVEWDETIVPVRIYIFDVTSWRSNDLYRCKVEYQVEPCDLQGVGNGKCEDTKKTRAVIPQGGDIVYGVAHQHTGGVGSALYGQDGRLLCSSTPIYGNGPEVGNEAGYIVGMSTCYPKPGSIRVSDGELLTIESNYSSARLHTGVMGLFYILVADPQPEASSILADAQTQARSIMHSLSSSTWGSEIMKYWWAFILVVAFMAVVVIISYRGRNNGDGYQSL